MNAQDLKNSILQRAIEGKLVPQRAEEGTARDLLAEIRAEKEKLIREKKIKKTKLLPEISDDEKPFEIPESWEWVRLGTLVAVLGGKRIPAGCKLTEMDTGHKYIRVSDMKNGSVMLSSIQYISEDIYQKIKRYTISENDVYITVAGTIGRIGTIPHELNNANLTENADKLVIYRMNKEFLCIALQSPFIQSQIKNVTTKVGQPKLAIKRIENFVVPLPPLAEQHRIVARIEELQPDIDAYDKAHTELRTIEQRFPDDMKKSLLQYAIEGKLVPQRKEEGTARELLAEIRTEKEKLIKEKKIKKTKPLPEITDDEKPFDIPDSWEWVKLGEISTYGYKTNKITASDMEPDMWILDLQDIEKDTGHIIRHKFVKCCTIKGDRTIFHKGDLLYSKLRPYLKKILIAPADGICTSELVPFQVYKGINAHYILWWLHSPFITLKVNASSYGVKMPRVGKETMINLLVPLPPLAEQHRIVARLEEMLPFCRQLAGESE